MAYVYSPAMYNQDVHIEMKVEISSDTPHGGIMVTNTVQTDPDGGQMLPQFPQEWFGYRAGPGPPGQQTIGTGMDESRMIGWMDDGLKQKEERRQRRRERKEEKRRQREADEAADLQTTLDDSLDSATSKQSPLDLEPRQQELPNNLNAHQPTTSAGGAAMRPTVQPRRSRENRQTSFIEEITDEVLLNTFEDPAAAHIHRRPIIEHPREQQRNSSFEDVTPNYSNQIAVPGPYQIPIFKTITETTTTTTTVEVIKHGDDTPQVVSSSSGPRPYPPLPAAVDPNAKLVSAVQDDSGNYQRYTYEAKETLLNDPAFADILPRRRELPAIQRARSKETLFSESANFEPDDHHRNQQPSTSYYHPAPVPPPPPHRNASMMTEAYDRSQHEERHEPQLSVSPTKTYSYQSRPEPVEAQPVQQRVQPQVVLSKMPTVMVSSNQGTANAPPPSKQKRVPVLSKTPTIFTSVLPTVECNTSYEEEIIEEEYQKSVIYQTPVPVPTKSEPSYANADAVNKVRLARNTTENPENYSSQEMRKPMPKPRPVSKPPVAPPPRPPSAAEEQPSSDSLPSSASSGNDQQQLQQRVSTSKIMEIYTAKSPVANVSKSPLDQFEAQLYGSSLDRTFTLDDHDDPSIDDARSGVSSNGIAAYPQPPSKQRYIYTIPETSREELYMEDDSQHDNTGTLGSSVGYYNREEVITSISRQATVRTNTNTPLANSNIGGGSLRGSATGGGPGSIDSERSSLSGIVRGAGGGGSYRPSENHSEQENLSDYAQGRLTPLGQELNLKYADSIMSQDSVVSQASNRHDRSDKYFDDPLTAYGQRYYDLPFPLADITADASQSSSTPQDRSFEEIMKGSVKHVPQIVRSVFEPEETLSRRSLHQSATSVSSCASAKQEPSLRYAEKLNRDANFDQNSEISEDSEVSSKVLTKRLREMLRKEEESLENQKKSIVSTAL